MIEYIRHDEGTFSSLTTQQKEAVGLLSIGTFLEYFDLMLYVHMAVLLNELFFPKADPHTQAIYSALAFCATFVFRPLGALIFGWIGDNIGRKATVIITTFMMAISCFIIANLPTYHQIGITATYLMIFCRIMQGISSLAEATGAELYITEMTKPPIQYFLVGLINVSASIGTFFALGIATFSTNLGLNWRYAFWFGLIIGIVGVIARTTLRETAEFANAKIQFLKLNKQNIDLLEKHPLWQEKIDKKTWLSYFMIQCTWPLIVYFVYIYCANILQNSFNYTSAQVIHHNFILSIIHMLWSIILCYLGYKIPPFKILKVIFIIFITIILLVPLILSNISTPFELLLLQLFCIFFGPKQSPAIPIFIKSFPILKRFFCTSFSYALSRAMIYPLTSFGIIYLIKYLNNYGLLVAFIPCCLGYWWGLKHFENLTKVNYKN